MEFNLLLQIKFLISIIISCSIIPQSNSALSLKYPQSSTLKNNNTLVVEENGIYICDSNFSQIIKTLYNFSEEDKITSLQKLSRTIISKSSYATVILNNYKVYVLNTTTGELLYNSENKLITDEEPDYIALPYIYSPESIRFYFLFVYLDSNDHLQLKYYEFFNNNNTITLHDSYSLDYVKKSSYYYNQTFYFRNKGISCNNLKDKNAEKKKYLTCFVIAYYDSTSTKEYLLPIIFDKSNEKLTFMNKTYKINYINADNVNQIKTDTNSAMNIVYICYNTENNIANCFEFSLNYASSSAKAVFNPIKNFEKKCRNAFYGMKVNYIFETKDVLFYCSDFDESFQTYFFEQNKLYFKYENCSSIYGYSVLYLNDLNDYYVFSDVNCPEGKIPFDILIRNGNFTPEIVAVDTTNQVEIIESTEVMESTSNAITELNNEITQKIINDCPEMCLECNAQKECTKCNRNKNYYPIELQSQINSAQTLICITDSIKKSQYPDFYFNTESESFKSCFETCATCYGKGDQDFHNCETCATGYIFHPDYEDSKNCVPKPNPYYYIKHDRYILTDSEICPDDFNFLIEAKSKCIEDCKKDDKYKYTYDELCYEAPPVDTNDDDNDFNCLDNPNKCIKTTKKLYTL